DTPIGRIASVICYDADFPSLVAQASEQDVDLLVVPAGDWSAIAQMHADMARIRAIEQGVSVLRPAGAGLTTVVDPYGRVLASHRFEPERPLASIAASVPVHGVRTLYGRLGDAFAWLSVLGLGMATALAVARRVRDS
ncbi:MAG: apolipoprotein acyltransferase, partial [Myxococcales bacterium]|nr:apolipoprotein acyltransferase [Myxococcales bacterium]